MKRDMVAALVIRDKRLLMVHNVKQGLRIEPPGGKKKDDEEWLIAVIREVYEELGVKVRPARLFGEYDTRSPEGEFRVRMYFSDITDGEPEILEPEKIPSFGWYTYAELERFREEGTLVPNMVEALPGLRKYL
jgi:8-oxo-dGTP pyrophosphatase MutT (NUDIX family)